MAEHDHNTLRVVSDSDSGAILTDEEALAVINEHWRAAREAYADAVAAIGHHYLRHLIVPPMKRSISRSHMAAIRDQARQLATHATRMADELDRATATYDRRTKTPHAKGGQS